MLKNYLTIAIRNLWRNKTYSSITIMGLAVGIMVIILVGLYANHEVSYDKHHVNADRIYRVNEISTTSNTTSTATPEVVSPILESNFPEVVNTARISGPGPTTVLSGGASYDVDLLETEQSFFDIFTVHPLLGNLSSALRDPGSVVVTESTAWQLFDRTNIIGETLESSRYGERELYHITAVIEDMPTTTNFSTDLIAYRPERGETSWQVGLVQTYILLEKGTSAQVLEAKLPELVAAQSGSSSMVLQLQPLMDIHLKSNFVGTFTGESLFDPMTALYMYLLVALLILLIAGANYVNMSIAGSLRRLDEIRIRKTVGAERRQLLGQFLIESILLSILAGSVALVGVDFALPYFNSVVQRDLSIRTLLEVNHLTQLILLVLGLGLATGFYPGYIIMRRMPTQELLRGIVPPVGRSGLRRGLIVLQFVASTALILSVLIIYGQVHYVRDARLNVDGDAVIQLQFQEIINSAVDSETFFADIQTFAEPFKNELLAQPIIISATTGNLPGQVMAVASYPAVDSTGRSAATIDFINGDPDYIETLGLELVAGRTFAASDVVADSRGNFQRWNAALAVAEGEGGLTAAEREAINLQYAEPVIVNETAIAWAGIEDPIGRYVGEFNRGRVIGVVKDFHTRSLHTTINPVVIGPAGSGTSIIRVDPDRIMEGIAAVKEVWDRFFPDYPFVYATFNELMDEAYQPEIRMERILGTFTLLAVLLASLGLFGLASLSTARRTKEIGIRKVVGASVTQVVKLLSKEFLVLVAIANVIAWPIAWYAMHRWLENFAYRIELSWWIFLLAGLLALVIALATVSWQTIRAATANPVEALRYE